MIQNKKSVIAQDVQAVITSFNQGTMIEEAVCSLCIQTTLPSKILVVDDGSTDILSMEVLQKLERNSNIPVPVDVIYQTNNGVSAARNSGIRKTQTPLVLILDGDDKLEPSYIEHVSGLLRTNPHMVAASSWMHTFGILDSIVCPSGGKLSAFLSRNACPATHILRRASWEICGGYDETMRTGFEDWEFFLHILECTPDSQIGIVKLPLINYRTAPASANVQSMTKRLELMRYMIEKHLETYQQNITDALLGIEATSMSRLYSWENEIIYNRSNGASLSETTYNFLQSPSYGDGGMAAAVRILSN